MSAASDAFEQSILDAENLLAHFNKLNTNPPPPETEVLKRAGLIMAMTAWETYVEDRVTEAPAQRLRSLTDESFATFVRARLMMRLNGFTIPLRTKPSNCSATMRMST